MTDTLATLIVALAFGAIHFAGRWFDVLHRVPRSAWLSFGGGVSVAYVFVHLLPELAEHEARVEAGFPFTYLMALAGLVVFYGLERLVRCAPRPEGAVPNGVFWTHLGAFALYNVLIGYLLVHREAEGGGELALYASALGVHFIVNDQGLRETHGRLYDRAGRWLLALAPPIGWAVGQHYEVPAPALAGLFALLAGSIVLNVLKEELPEERESRFGAFLFGAGAYTLVLLLI